MEELLYPVLDGIEHLSWGAFSGKATRRLLGTDYGKNKEAANTLGDAFNGLYPDSDIAVSYLQNYLGKFGDYLTLIWGEHRGNFHIPYIGFATGFAFGFARDVILYREINPRRACRNAVSGGVAMLSHFFADLLEGGSLPLGFGYSVELHNGFGGLEPMFYVASIGMPLLGLVYFWRKKRNKDSASIEDLTDR